MRKGRSTVMWNSTGFFQRLLEIRLSWWQRYLAATALIGLATLLRLQLWGLVRGFPYLVYIPFIIVCGLMLNSGTAIYALILSAIAAVFFFVEPRNSLDVLNTVDLFGLVLFLVVGLAIAIITENMRRLVEQLKETLATVASTNRELERTVRERDVLLNELEHRTKNDFQIAASLLRLESAELLAEDGKAALTAAADRIAVVARVHGRFTHQSGFAKVDLRSFLSDLVADFRKAHIGARPVTIELSAEPVEVIARLAIYIGLIVNELLTNAIKYAFPDAREGRVRVALTLEERTLVLLVTDNGVGWTQGKSGTGARLIESLVHLLGGHIEREARAGASIHVRVPLPAEDAPEDAS